METPAPELQRLVQHRLQEQVQDGLSAELIAEFTGSALTTVQDWINEIRLPEGERLVKLWHLLAIASSPPEFNMMPPLSLYASQLFGYGIFDIEEVKTVLNIANSQGAFRTMRGSKPAKPLYTLEELQSDKDAELQQAFRVWRARVLSSTSSPDLLPPTPVRQTVPEPVVKSPTATQPKVMAKTGLCLELASQLSALLPKLRYFNSDDISPEDRSLLRELLGSEGMFEASNLLNLLCSERARTLGR